MKTQLTELEKSIYNYWIENDKDESKLVDYISRGIPYNDYEKLKGSFSDGKAKKLIKKFKTIEVDTYTVSKDFILEAHKDACSTWKTKIENQFPELFPKVEPVTGWFKQKQSYGYWLGYYENDELKYTITDDGFKTIKLKVVRNLDECKEEVKATKEEVETALIAEARK